MRGPTEEDFARARRVGEVFDMLPPLRKMGDYLKMADQMRDTSKAISDRQRAMNRRDFTYHPPKGDQPERYERLRAAGHALAETIMDLTPYSREQSLALTNLEQAIMWANAAIARNE